MKKNLFMVAAVVLMAMISCNKEQINGTSDVQEPAEDVIADIPFEFSAYADGADTQAPSVNPASVQQKTTLNTTGDKPKTHWLATDKISVNGFEFSVDKETAYGESARFLGQVSESFAAPYKAVYPASAGSFDALEVPAVQTAVAGDFDQSAVIGVAYSEKDNTLAFKNVTSLLKFQVPAAADFSEKITSITITSTDYIAGTVSIDFEGTLPKVTVKKGVKTITVNCSDGFDPAKTYYAAVLPVTKSNLVVRINGYLSKNAASVTVNRSTIANMKTLPAPVASGWTIVGAHNSWNVSTGIKLYNDISGAVAKNVTGGSEFKLVKNGSEWFSTMVPAGKKGSWCKLHMNRVNMKPASGSVDVWVNADGTACGVVDKNASMPSTYQYYVVLQHNWSWSNRKLHSWIVNPESNLMGNWPGSSPIGTFNYENNGYSYWEIPTKANELRIGVIFSNNGSDQTQNHYIDPLNTDKCYWLEYRSGKGNFPVEM